jgi:hypothetical protein
MTPASAASAAPITNVAEMTVSGLTPISAATRGFSAVARIARPSRVRLTRYMRPESVATVATRIRIWTLLITAPKTMCGSPGSRIGYDL